MFVSYRASNVSTTHFWHELSFETARLWLISDMISSVLLCCSTDQQTPLFFYKWCSDPRPIGLQRVLLPVCVVQNSCHDCGWQIAEVCSCQCQHDRLRYVLCRKIHSGCMFDSHVSSADMSQISSEIWYMSSADMSQISSEIGTQLG